MDHVSELELTGAQFQQKMDAVLRRMKPILDGLRDSPADYGSPAEVPRARPLPDAPAPFEEVLDDFEKRLRAGVNPASGGFMGFIPGGGLPHAALADVMSDISNRYIGVSFQVPQLAAIETEALRWLADIIGYPAGATGTFTSGGSAANLLALAAARDDRFPDSGNDDSDPSHGTIYVSDQAHHSVLKAARITGIRSRQVRVLPTDSAFRMDVDALREAVQQDREAGLQPFLLVASAGTTNTGAVDPLSTLADFAAAEDMWYHVDAAYGGLFAATERGAHTLRGIDRADSVVLDPHKTMFLPYGTGALLVREPRRMAQAFRMNAAYLPPSSDDQPPQPSDLSFELTRPFRGLRVWLPLRLHGIAPFRQQLDEKLDLAIYLARSLSDMPQLEIIAEPQLSTFAFASRARDGEDMTAVNERTAKLLERVNADGAVLVTATTLRGGFAIRPSIVSFRTHRSHVDMLLQRLRDAVSDM